MGKVEVEVEVYAAAGSYTEKGGAAAGQRSADWSVAMTLGTHILLADRRSSFWSA